MPAGNMSAAICSCSCCPLKELHIALVTDPTLFILEVFEGSLVGGTGGADHFPATPAMVPSPYHRPKDQVAELQCVRKKNG